LIVSATFRVLALISDPFNLERKKVERRKGLAEFSVSEFAVL